MNEPETRLTAPAREKPAIFFMLCPERGAFNASFTLAQRLKDREYEIAYLGTPDFEAYVTAQGFGYHAFSLAPNPHAAALRESWPAFMRRWRTRRHAFLHVEKACQQIVEHAKRIVQEKKPVLMLVDPLVSWQSVLPYLCGVPTIGVNATMASTFDPHIPPAFSELLPAQESLPEMARNWLAWGRILSHQWYRRFASEKIVPLTLGLLPRRSPVSAVKHHGARVLWSEYGPWIDLPELVLSVRQLDFPRSALVRNRVYAGSCVHLPRADGTVDWKGFDADAPLVYCSLGTYSHAYPHARRLFETVIEALMKRKDGLQGIVQIGDVGIDVPGDLPERIRVVERVPQLEILQRARVFVTHGGASSVREALYFGVPTIVLPGWLDQFGNSARVVYHGLGLRADMATITAERMSALLDEIMDERFLRANARMRQHLQEQASCQAGVDFVESFLQGRAAPHGALPAAPVTAKEA
jgi:UDP:flavonoid glycosyltransferase YjiC (YdhE family)